MSRSAYEAERTVEIRLDSALEPLENTLRLGEAAVEGDITSAEILAS